MRLRWLGFAVLLVVMLVSGPARAADFTVTLPSTCCQSYLVNGVPNKPLTLVRGHTYTFDVSTPNHPFFIKSVQSPTGTNWDEGVTNNGTTGVGTPPSPLTFTVPADAPATLFYQCGIHAAMTGTITITSPVPAAGRGAFAALALGLAGLAAVALRRRRTA